MDVDRDNYKDINEDVVVAAIDKVVQIFVCLFELYEILDRNLNIQ